MKRSLRNVSLVACMFAVAPSMRAQDIALGSHVRVVRTSAATPLEGSLVARTADSLTLGFGTRAMTVAMPMDSIRSIDVDEGVRASHHAVIKYALIGTAIGAGAGVVLSQSKCTNRGVHDGGPSCLLENLVFTVPLSIAGALFGSLVAKKDDKERWSRVYEREAGTALLIGPARHHGFVAEIAIHFGGSGA